MTAFGDTHSDAEIEELCELMLGLDRPRLLAALERLEDRGAFSEWQSQTLADAMRLALKRDPAFVATMGDIISKGVHSTVERDSVAFGRALAPAMGPAIRNAVRLMLQGFVSSIENVVDQQLSWRSVRWRLEARRTGRSFAEVAFRHTLLFRVEHVFLVHRDGGVQLQHVSPPDVLAKEPDLIAAMMTAIQDFVSDAFEVPSGDTLTSFAVGDLQVGVESGSHAVIAAVVRGKPPSTLRLQLREALDQIESSMGRQFAHFDGDVEAFEAARPYLEGCLVKSQLPGKDQSKKKKKKSWMPWVLLGAAVLWLVWLSIGWIEQADTEQRFAAFIDELRNEPGIVVTSVEPTESGWLVRGLRDPLSRPVDGIAGEHRLSGKVEHAMRPHHALHPAFVLQRAMVALAPPPGVAVALEADRLILTGRAGHRWREQSAAIARAFPGITTVDIAGLEDSDEAEWQAAAAELSQGARPMPGLQRGFGSDHRWLTGLAGRLASSGRILDRQTVLRCKLLVPEGDDSVAATRQARELADQLGGAIGLPIEIIATETDTSATERQLRFEASYSSR